MNISGLDTFEYVLSPFWHICGVLRQRLIPCGFFVNTHVRYK
nr:MAG TPA: hypothetical protein [Caudoviricetes sp.]